MKKFLSLSIIFLIITANINAAQKNLTKLVGGTALTGMGAILMYWGFSFQDTSIPRITMQSFTWAKKFNTTWEENYSGTIKNSGNVELSNIKLYLTFKDTNGIFISTQQIAGPDVLGTGDKYNFSNSYDTGSVEPGTVSVLYSASFSEMLENRNIAIGITGIAVAACGLFFMADYLFDFTEPLKENNVSMEITPCFAGIKLITSKTF